MDKYICRTCLYVSDNISLFKIVDKVEDILVQCVPELKPNISKDTIVCSQCYYFLKNIENFKTKCIENQQKLINHKLISVPHQNDYFAKENIVSSHKQSKTKRSDWDKRSGSSEENECTSLLEEEVFQLPSHTSISLVKRIKLNDNDISSTHTNNISKHIRSGHLERTEARQSNSTTSKPETIKKVKMGKETNVDVNEIIEISDIDSDIDMENGDRTTVCCDDDDSKDEDDDIFEEKEGTKSLKNDSKNEENPSFFNKQNEEGYYNCKLCSNQYKTSQDLYEHTFRDHTELKFFHCASCNFFSLWKSALSRHESLFHLKENPFHEDKLSEEPLFLFCYHCTFKTQSKEELEVHLKVHFNPLNTTYTCSICRRNFYRKFLYDNHLKAHRENETATCIVCKKGYTKRHLRDHMKAVHKILV